MKCVINSASAPARWLEEFFPDVSPYKLKFANKPLLEYYIDFCDLLGVEEVRLVTDQPDVELEKFFADGSRWGVKLSYGISKTGDGIRDVIAKNQSFVGSGALLVIDGFMFLDYDKETLKEGLFSPDEGQAWLSCPSGSMMYLPSAYAPWHAPAGAPDTHKTVRLLPIESISDYYNLSMDVLKNKSHHYILPGYNNEDGVFIGQNVEIGRGAVFEKPVIIGNNVGFKESTRVGPAAIIGFNTLIDRGTVVEESIVYDNSYVGADLEIKRKIVNRNCLIDPDSGEKLEIVDDFLLSGVNVGALRNFGCQVVHLLVALPLAALFALPYFFFLLFVLPFTKHRPRMVECFLSQDGSKKRRIPIYGVPPRSVPLILFHKLSLDKFPLLIEVIRGYLYLSGNMPLECNEHNRELLKDMRLYHPAVFSYSGMLGAEAGELFERELNELYYSNNASLRLDLKILVKTLIVRALS